MRIKAITPMYVGDEELRRRQQRYDRLCPTGLRITLVDLPDDPRTPRALDTADDIRASERLVVAEARRTDPREFDAVMPDCVLDPGVPELDEHCPVPVLGITRLATGLLASLGRPFAAVARNEAIAAELRAVIERYGLGWALQEVAVLGLRVTDISDEARWSAAVAAVAPRLSGAAAIVNGCSAVEVDDVGTGAPLVDPTALALDLASLAAVRGLVKPSPATNGSGPAGHGAQPSASGSGPTSSYSGSTNSNNRARSGAGVRRSV
jgi:Asp/Glu/hydantoin racemase